MPAPAVGTRGGGKGGTSSPRPGTPRDASERGPPSLPFSPKKTRLPPGNSHFWYLPRGPTGEPRSLPSGRPHPVPPRPRNPSGPSRRGAALTGAALPARLGFSTIPPAPSAARGSPRRPGGTAAAPPGPGPPLTWRRARRYFFYSAADEGGWDFFSLFSFFLSFLLFFFFFFPSLQQVAGRQQHPSPLPFASARQGRQPGRAGPEIGRASCRERV